MGLTVAATPKSAWCAVEYGTPRAAPCANEARAGRVSRDVGDRQHRRHRAGGSRRGFDAVRVAGVLDDANFAAKIDRGHVAPGNVGRRNRGAEERGNEPVEAVMLPAPS